MTTLNRNSNYNIINYYWSIWHTFQGAYFLTAVHKPHYLQLITAACGILFRHYFAVLGHDDLDRIYAKLPEYVFDAGAFFCDLSSAAIRHGDQHFISFKCSCAGGIASFAGRQIIFVRICLKGGPYAKCLWWTKERRYAAQPTGRLYAGSLLAGPSLRFPALAERGGA